MSKKVKVIISVVVTVFLLTIGIATAVMAQDNGSTANTTGANGLLARVAGNLGISQGELTDAFQQARQELRQEMRQMWQERRQEAFLKAVDRAGGDGIITQDEADEIIEWWGEKPEALSRIWSPRFSDCFALGNGHMWNKRWHGQRPQTD